MCSKEMENEETVFVNALNCISFLGPQKIEALINHFGSARAAWAGSTAELREIKGLAEHAEKLVHERAAIDPFQKWKELQDKGITCLTFNDDNYPPLLKQIPSSPPVVYYRGDPQPLDRPAVAIVGSRRCTFYGREVANRLAKELTTAGVSVISGMALGVDTAAHRGTLENGGYTAAVLGCGLDICYPHRNQDLMEQIIANGVVLSEFPPGTIPLPAHFPRRNRIISGLSLGTVVVEATAKSGALITAHYALEQNREVFAVPGNVGSPYSRGCHRLLKEGARLVESVEDILNELYLEHPAEKQLSISTAKPALTDGEKALLSLIPYQPIHIDNLIKLSGGSPAEVVATLLSLELKKYISQSPGKFFCRT
ncbi:MAG: DNA-processing protein DprA [Bacillota bacterium]|nr:DNA-processing protein DprA [Bacillota bacterium]